MAPMGKRATKYLELAVMNPRMILRLLLVIGFLLTGCRPSPVALEVPPDPTPSLIPDGMSPEEAATLSSLQQVDEYPLYTMTYQANYSNTDIVARLPSGLLVREDWACSLFAAFGDLEEMVFGRNFDWDFSPGLLLFTDPEEGYASVSMVDLYYLGFGNEQAYGLTDLPLIDLSRLLDAPYLPFDGLNETGLAVGMAAVPDGGMVPDPEKETIDSLMVIRKILDGAATIEEAVEIIQAFNIDWGSGPTLHYLVAEGSGRSALIEFSRGEIRLLENQGSWQAATNFLVSEAWGDPATHCWRYEMIADQLEASGGRIGASQAMDLLEGVSQANTQWSVVYRISAKEVWITMGTEYREIHQFEFKPGQ